MKWQKNWLVSPGEETAWAAAALSPLTFARRFLRFFPDEAQAGVLGRSPEYSRILLNCSRQWGKSTVAAAMAVHRLVFEDGATVLVVGPTARQSRETVRKAASFLRVLEIRTRGENGSQDARVLPNGSRMVALPAVEATIRGFSAVSMLIVDEASRVPDEVYHALLPSLAVSNGDLILLSTPRGKRGFFYREMTEGGPAWLKHTGPVTECKRISEEFLEQERARGEQNFEQEYLCQFVETGKYLLDEALVRAMVTKKEEPWRLNG